MDRVAKARCLREVGVAIPPLAGVILSPKMLGFLQKLLLIYVCKLLEATNIKQCILFSSISQ